MKVPVCNFQIRGDFSFDECVLIQYNKEFETQFLAIDSRWTVLEFC